MDFRKWSDGYDELRNIIKEVCNNEHLTDILFFNEVVKHELMCEMKKVSDEGFTRKHINQFRKFIKNFNEKIIQEEY